MVGLRELLGCNVIVFDAVILQCRAYTHASAASAARSVVITARALFPPLFPLALSSSASSFAFRTSCRGARQPPLSLPLALRSHLPSRTSFPSCRPGTPRGVPANVLTFSLGDHPPRVISAARWESHRDFRDCQTRNLPRSRI